MKKSQPSARLGKPGEPVVLDFGRPDAEGPEQGRRHEEHQRARSTPSAAVRRASAGAVQRALTKQPGLMHGRQLLRSSDHAPTLTGPCEPLQEDRTFSAIRLSPSVEHEEDLQLADEETDDPADGDQLPLVLAERWPEQALVLDGRQLQHPLFDHLRDIHRLG